MVLLRLPKHEKVVVEMCNIRNCRLIHKKDIKENMNGDRISAH
jgi:hypothetical protein